MATAQKRGFHFPWGGDSHPAGSAEPVEVNDEPSLAERLGVIPDDLGSGPFDVRVDDETDEEPAEGDAVTDQVTGSAERSGDVGQMNDADAVGRAEAATDSVVASEPESEPAGSVAQASAPPLPGDAQPAPSDAAPAATAGEAAPATSTPEQQAAWPEVDRRAHGEQAATTADAPEAAANRAATAAARRANPLVTGLVRAMRDAAKVAREEALASLHADVVARTDAIRTQSTATAAMLRRNADADVTAIREWSKAEMARIREETETRIGARKQQLVTETEDAARSSDELVARLGRVVEAYEAETASFFEALLAEEDPARLAGLAERMPAPPTLDEFPKTTAASAGDGAHGGAEPTAEPAAAVEAAAAADAASALEPAPATAEDEVVPHDAVDAPDAEGLDPDAAAAAEAEALAGLEGQTEIIVSGLTNVAAIAGFKAGLMKVEGVSAVSVMAGSDGECMFTVTHGPETELRDGLRDLEAFQTRLIADDGSSLIVVAHEPAA